MPRRTGQFSPLDTASSARRPRCRSAVNGLALTVTLMIASGCQEQSTVVKYKPFFSNIADAKFSGQGPVNPNEGYIDPTVATDQKIVIEHADGSKTLIAKSVQHMMVHLQRCLEENEDDLLVQQVLSTRTIEHFRANGRSPMELIESLKDNRKEIARTFGRMPLAEHSPTVILDQPGDRMWVIRVTGAAAKGLKFTRLWARLEDGNWKFVWLD